MSALTVLYLVLPFPIAFIIHDAEEVVVQHRWMLKHQESLSQRFPRARTILESLSQLSTKAFAIAAIEELVVLLFATAWVLVGGWWVVEVWSALFMAFSFHLLVHIGQAIVVRGYVPGVVTSILLLPYVCLGMQSIWHAMSGGEIAFYGLLGIGFMVLNLRFAHWMGKKLT